MDIFSIIKFVLLLSFQIPSLLCTGFIFYHFRWQSISTQIYGFLLITNGLITSIELSITLYFLHQGTIHDISRCTPWILLNYSLFLLSIFLMVWTSIERYLFIHHDQFIKDHIIILHYIPIAVLHIYSPLLYIGLVIIYPCTSAYDVQFYLCGGPCYSLERAVGLYDWFGNGVMMQVIILVMNVVLIVRHLIQRKRMQRMTVTADGRRKWRRSVRLIVQLMFAGIIYGIAWIPYSILVMIQIFQSSEFVVYLLTSYFVYLPYVQSLMLPYVCLLFIPEIKQKFFALRVFTCCCKHQIMPELDPSRTNIRETAVRSNTAGN